MGDALYALPAIRELAERHGPVDFYTSSYCAPMRRLFEAQYCVERFIVAEDYVLQDFGCGARPWTVPIPEGYEAVYQMGFEHYPEGPIPDYIATHVGLPAGLPIHYDFDLPDTEIDGPYIVTAPRGYTEYSHVFRAIADHCPIAVVEIGAAGDGTGSPRAIDKTGLDMLEVLPWLCGARGFYGLHSAMLVLANGFPIPKVAPQGRWDMRHVVRSPYNQYPVEPDGNEILKRLGVTMTYCKTLDPSDYEPIHETQHADSMKRIVGTYGGRAEHPHRAWEYGIILHALREHGCKSILDVGGGGSVFAPAASWVGIEVTAVDPEDYAAWVAQQNRIVAAHHPGSPAVQYVREDFMAYQGGEFDAVTCGSVLEHVPDDFAFFAKLASHVRVGGLLALTVDFWPDAARKSPDHLRTYNEDRLSALAQSVPGFETLGPLDYADRGAHVYIYTFASLMLRRVS
jgi:SAM-dependent methyltransferase